MYQIIACYKEQQYYVLDNVKTEQEAKKTKRQNEIVFGDDFNIEIIEEVE